MSQSCVREVVHEVAHATTVVDGQKRSVDFPQTPGQKLRVLGCVGGTLIAIQKPGGLSLGDTGNYVCRNGFYAINTMIVSSSLLVQLFTTLPWQRVSLPRMMTLPPPPLRVPAPEEVALRGKLQRACAVNLFWGQRGGNADHLRRVRRRMKRQRTA
ncbi:hypothetical protein HPB50_003099 [Hyalomma asiaticum]|uniref:Uncharacterized protein n=1 Tax=Hyalomma asiaticum TaxID=266040 RepID=A0ACB7RGZ6_HYAAI|nr:hypothetical protein HPB50_003099 [Hyalomma asiaticum]